MKRLLCFLLGHDWWKYRFGEKTFYCRRCKQINVAGEAITDEGPMSKAQFVEMLNINRQMKGLKFKSLDEWIQEEVICGSRFS